MESGASPEIEGVRDFELVDFLLDIYSPCEFGAYPYLRTRRPSRPSFDSGRPIAMLFRSLFVASLLALSTNAWANDLTNLERVHHVGAISQTQKSLLDAWSEGRALQLEPVFGSYYLVLGKDGSALDKGWAATLPAGTQQLAVFRESQKTSLKISDGRLRFRLTKEGRLRSVSQALAGFSPKFSVVHQQTRVYEAVLSAPGAVLEASRAMNALADTLWATPDFIYKKSLKGETNDPLLQCTTRGSEAVLWDISQGSAGCHRNH